VYLHALAVILYYIALLQAIKDHFQTVVKVRLVVLVKDIHRELEHRVNPHASDIALEVEGFLVGFQLL